MIDLSAQFVAPLLWATSYLAAAALSVQLLLYLWQPKSLGVRRAAWSLVLAQGILFMRLPVDVPLLSAPNPAIDGNPWNQSSGVEILAVMSAEPTAGPAPQWGPVTPTSNLPSIRATWDWQHRLAAVWLLSAAQPPQGERNGTDSRRDRCSGCWSIGLPSPPWDRRVS